MKSKANKIVLLLLGVLALTLLGGVVFQRQLFWQLAKTRNSIEGYHEFISRYGSDPATAGARARLLALLDERFTNITGFIEPLTPAPEDDIGLIYISELGPFAINNLVARKYEKVGKDSKRLLVFARGKCRQEMTHELTHAQVVRGSGGELRMAALHNPFETPRSDRDRPVPLKDCLEQQIAELP